MVGGGGHCLCYLNGRPDYLAKCIGADASEKSVGPMV